MRNKVLLSALCMVCAMHMSVVAGDALGNLVQNGSFENGLTSWSEWWASGDRDLAKAGTTDSNKYDGERALEADMPPDSRWAVSQYIKVKPSTSYRAKCFYFTPMGSQAASSIRVSYYGEDEKFRGYFGYKDFPQTANIWCDFGIEFTTMPDTAQIMLEFNIYGPGKCYLDNVVLEPIDSIGKSWDELYPDNSPIVMKVPKISDKKKKSFPYWTYACSAGHYSQLATVLGVPYSIENEFATATKHGLMPFYHQWHDSWPKLAKEYKTGILWYPFAPLIGKGFDTDYCSGIVSPNDPVLVNAMLDEVKNESFDKAAKDAPLFFFIRDEIFYSFMCVPKDISSVKTDYWKQMDENVRKSTGFGKFGMPTGPDDYNPFRRIAFGLYQNGLLLKNTKMLADAFRKHHPKGTVMGFDEWSAFTPVDWESIGKMIDIQPGQALHTNNGQLQFATAMMTHFYVDLTKKPSYPFLQIVKYPSAPTIKQLNEMVNQGLRGGATGFFVGTVEWFDRCNGSPEFAAPENWNAYLKLLDMARSTEPWKRPDDKLMALHFSDYTLFASRENVPRKTPAAFAILGPRSRSNFKFVDDYQLARNPALPADYKVFVVSDAKYTTHATLNGLEDAVKQGTTAVIMDIEAFQYDIDGTSLEDERNNFLGVKTTGEHYCPKIIIDGTSLENPNFKVQDISILDQENVSVIAKDSTGAPAIIQHNIGKGKVIYFLTKVTEPSVVDSTDWIREFRKMIPQWGAKIDYDYWRRSLPEVLPDVPFERQHKCISGNGMLMVRNYPDKSMNAADVKCRYKWQHAPNEWPDAKPEGDRFITADKGLLLNRLSYFNLERKSNGSLVNLNEFERNKWAVCFGYDEIGDNSVVFDFENPVDVDTVRIFFAGSMGTVSLLAGHDEKNMNLIGKGIAIDTEEHEVAELKINASGNKEAFRYWRISWPKRRDGKRLIISEIDFWK